MLSDYKLQRVAQELLKRAGLRITEPDQHAAFIAVLVKKLKTETVVILRLNPENNVYELR